MSPTRLATRTPIQPYAILPIPFHRDAPPPTDCQPARIFHGPPCISISIFLSSLPGIEHVTLALCLRPRTATLRFHLHPPVAPSWTDYSWTSLHPSTYPPDGGRDQTAIEYPGSGPYRSVTLRTGHDCIDRRQEEDIEQSITSGTTPTVPSYGHCCAAVWHLHRALSSGRTAASESLSRTSPTYHSVGDPIRSFTGCRKIQTVANSKPCSICSSRIRPPAPASPPLAHEERVRATCTGALVAVIVGLQKRRVVSDYCASASGLDSIRHEQLHRLSGWQSRPHSWD